MTTWIHSYPLFKGFIPPIPDFSWQNSLFHVATVAQRSQRCVTGLADHIWLRARGHRPWLSGLATPWDWRGLRTSASNLGTSWG